MTYYKGSKLKFETIRTVAFGSVTASYTPLGSSTTSNASLVIINNSLDKDILLSFDGSTDTLYLSAMETMILNIDGNKSGTGQLVLPTKTQFSIKRGPGGAPSSGNVYVMVGYAG